MDTGISSVAMLSNENWFVSKYPTGCCFSGWSKCQWHGYRTHLQVPKETCEFTNLVDIATSAISVFKTSLSKALNNGEIDKPEFQILQELHLMVINELANVDRKMESEIRNQFQKICWKKSMTNDLKKECRKKIPHDVQSLSCLCYQNGQAPRYLLST